MASAAMSAVIVPVEGWAACTVTIGFSSASSAFLQALRKSTGAHSISSAAERNDFVDEVMVT
jgi:hypothetical protein